MNKATVIIADNMSNETYELLLEGTKKKFGADIEFEKKLDNSIIGGFVMQYMGMVYDYSLKSQLDRLKAHISN